MQLAAPWWEGEDKKATLKGSVSVGVVSLAMAGSMGVAQAQEAVPLPPLEVTAKAAKAKKKPAPAPRQPAQSAPSVEAAPVEPVPTEPVSGFGDGSSLTPPSGNTLQSGTGLGRLPGTMQDTPQTINVIPQQQIEEQNITTLDQALRNVPGVTVAIGEGGGGMNGDQFRIRGFQAKGDIYVDGLRDFGVYVRDAFAYEQVEVIKGPASEIVRHGHDRRRDQHSAEDGASRQRDVRRRHGRLRTVLSHHHGRELAAQHHDGGARRRHVPRSGSRRSRPYLYGPLGFPRIVRDRHQYGHDLGPELPASVRRA